MNQTECYSIGNVGWYTIAYSNAYVPSAEYFVIGFSNYYSYRFASFVKAEFFLSYESGSVTGYGKILSTLAKTAPGGTSANKLASKVRILCKVFSTTDIKENRFWIQIYVPHPNSVFSDTIRFTLFDPIGYWHPSVGSYMNLNSRVSKYNTDDTPVDNDVVLDTATLTFTS